MEHAESYVRSVLAFIGITEPQVVIAEGVALNREAAIERGRASISGLIIGSGESSDLPAQR
jgi:FMN-dependent NADH-azoreductase